ncbi:MAG: permease [Bacilli bacterium]|nr:permease [Bacilli bacterium]
MQNISIIFLSILLESLPYLLLGSIISAIIERYVTDEMIVKWIPKNKILGSITGVLLGFFIPACDCAIIPVSRKLIQKKVPLNVAVSFMLASPIINPVVLLSTYQAFKNSNPEMIWYRLILGIMISLIIGIILGILQKEDILLEQKENKEEHCHCDHHKKEKGWKNTVKEILEHAAYDFTDVLKYMIIGSLIASIVQVFLPKELMNTFQSNSILSIFVLMTFAYIISLCSTSDSFIGSSLLQVFQKEAILAYLIVGPMIDIKNTIVLLGSYKKSFVIQLIALIFGVTFLSILVVMAL